MGAAVSLPMIPLPAFLSSERVFFSLIGVNIVLAIIITLAVIL